ncbi:hypothetical protein RLIN73S_07522 [Rhodanobacter lindaniclasticus]
MRGGDIAAEHHRVETVIDKLLEVGDEQTQLGVTFLAGQCLGFDQQRVQGRIASIGSGYDIVPREVIFGTVEQWAKHLFRSVVYLLGAQAFSACTAAAGLLATQRISASVPQKLKRCRRSSSPARWVTSRQ